MNDKVPWCTQVRINALLCIGVLTALSILFMFFDLEDNIDACVVGIVMATREFVEK